MKRNIKVLILSDPSSSHTSKWVNSLFDAGIDLILIGLADYDFNEYNRNIKIEVIDFSKSAKGKPDGDPRKLVYLRSISFVKKIIKSFKPDILHAHYASSYGLIGALCGFQPLLVSVWGNDVYDFPKKSFIHKKSFEYVLKKSYRIFSTSKIMADEISKYTNKNIKIIPFGIDVSIFKPFETEKLFPGDTIILGAVKSLSYKYGNDKVIKAYKIVKEKLPEYNLKLLLVGDGILKQKMEELVVSLGLTDDVKFIGKVPHSQVTKYHNMIDIHIYPSIWESFGVSNLEAAACEKVQVASNIGGFKEILNDGIDSFLVDPNSLEDIVDKIILLIKNKELRIKMGKEARNNVIKKFNWQDNVKDMIEEYYSVLKGYK
ncbi:MAG: glycosyltransferase family 4 protein [Ignavibacterium sp.]|nr:glycosyltransferase family 4 protein [Ignavibacterium sp.]MDW8375656.1 glycosyltransferase family 4 protein [Ignavibacteriales bacterium]